MASPQQHAVRRAVIVGYGPRGRHWHKLLAGFPGVQPAAIAVRNPAALQNQDDVSLRVPVFASISEASRATRAEICIVAAPATARRENCEEALAAGMHLLVEKPFALSLQTATEIIACARAQSRQVVIGQNYRYSPEATQAALLVRNGTLGVPGSGIFTRTRRRPGKGTYQQHLRHGYLWEMAVHDFDLIRYTLGQRPAEVFGKSWLPPWSDYTGETTVQAVLQFERGARVTYTGAWGSALNEFA